MRHTLEVAERQRPQRLRVDVLQLPHLDERWGTGGIAAHDIDRGMAGDEPCKGRGSDPESPGHGQAGKFEDP
jgi:hypothetical protein